MGLKVLPHCGFSQSDFCPVKKKMFAANSGAINILSAVFVRLTGVDYNNSNIKAAEIIYVFQSILIES